MTYLIVGASLPPHKYPGRPEADDRAGGRGPHRQHQPGQHRAPVRQRESQSQGQESL